MKYPTGSFRNYCTTGMGYLPVDVRKGFDDSHGALDAPDYIAGGSVIRTDKTSVIIRGHFRGWNDNKTPRTYARILKEIHEKGASLARPYYVEHYGGNVYAVRNAYKNRHVETYHIYTDARNYARKLNDEHKR